MDGTDSDKQLGAIARLLTDLFTVEAVYRHDRHLTFRLTTHFDRTRSEKLLRDRLRLAGYTYRIEASDTGLELRIDPQRRLRIPTLNIVLFVATLFSVYVVPVLLRNLVVRLDELAVLEDRTGAATSGFVWFVHSLLLPALRATGADLAAGEGLIFAIALMSILLVHESGHFIAGRRRQVVTSWPYFIPAPNIIGSFGAVIVQKTPFRNRRDLLEVATAGPIAGWILAILWLAWGLSNSVMVPLESLSIDQMGFFLEGESLLMRVATLAIVGSAPEGFAYSLTEAAFAGWVGLLVTAINLLPIGQLDGGHVVYGLARRYQPWLARLAVAGLILLGLQSHMWWFFAALGLIFGVRHPPTLDDERSPGRSARILGIISLGILLLSFTPVPFR